MNKPKRQHSIPRSYLNNFSTEKDGKKAFVYAQNKNSKEIKRYSTKDLCVHKNLYTLPSKEEHKKFIIEDYYDKNIDSVYSEVYKILVDKNVTEIDVSTRLKIIKTALSLYFRTPKFLNICNQFTDNLLNIALDMHPEGEIIEIDYLGKPLIFNRIEFSRIKKEINESSRINFLLGHLDKYKQFVQHKINSGIGVLELNDESEFITSDNPVIIRNSTSIYSTIFDPKNTIILPIDNKHLLQILPSDESTLQGTFTRIKWDYASAITTNMDIERHSEKWIIGNKISINNHFENQGKYNQGSTHLHSFEYTLEKKLELYHDYFALRSILLEDVFNGRINLSVINEIKKISESNLLESDENIQDDLKILRSKGYIN